MTPMFCSTNISNQIVTMIQISIFYNKKVTPKNHAASYNIFVNSLVSLTIVNNFKKTIFDEIGLLHLKYWQQILINWSCISGSKFIFYFYLLFFKYFLSTDFNYIFLKKFFIQKHCGVRYLKATGTHRRHLGFFVYKLSHQALTNISPMAFYIMSRYDTYFAIYYSLFITLTPDNQIRTRNFIKYFKDYNTPKN